MEISDGWFDSEGLATFWRHVPLRTIKKAFFTKGNNVRALAKLVLNGVSYNFNETAQGGAVIASPDYSAIEFISPDGRIDYNTLLGGTLGNALTVSIEVLETAPIPAWDRFAEWFAGDYSGIMSQLSAVTGSCELQTIDGRQSTVVSIPDFSDVDNMASILSVTKAATQNAHNHALSIYRLDNAAFGWALKLTSLPDANGQTSSMTLGFLFRE